jgi:general stress protein 26
MNISNDGETHKVNVSENSLGWLQSSTHFWKGTCQQKQKLHGGKSMSNELSHDEKLAKVRELVKGIDIAMLTTIDENGDLHGRPMSVNGEVEFDGDLWFFTYGSAHKVHEVEGDQRANASFSNPKDQTYVSLSGNVEVVRDRAKIEELWQPISRLVSRRARKLKISRC